VTAYAVFLVPADIVRVIVIHAARLTGTVGLFVRVSRGHRLDERAQLEKGLELRNRGIATR